MAFINYDLSDPLHFPPLSKRFYAKRHNIRSQSCKQDDEEIGTSNQIDDLSDDILELILTRVSPWRYLAKSKCVSKRWNSTISNPDFVRHLKHEHYPFTLLLRDYDYYGICGKCVISEHPHFQKHKFRLEFIPTDFDYWLGNRAIDIVANNNDVLLSYCILEFGKEEYCIANPLTKKYVVVPITMDMQLRPFYYYSHWMIGIVGVINGVSSVSAINNPHDPNCGFRIVRVIHGRPTLVAQIYSSQMGQWKAYTFNSFDIYFDNTMFSRQATTLNNTVYWLMRSKILVIDPFEDHNVVAPRILNLPEEIDYNSVLDVCKNRLRVAYLQIESVNGCDNPRIKVWQIEDYDNLATNYTAKLRLVIDITLTRSILERFLSPTIRLFPKKYSYYRDDKVICCHPNDANVVYFFYEDALYFYDVVKHRCKVVTYCPSDWNQRFVFVHPLLVIVMYLNRRYTHLFSMRSLFEEKKFASFNFRKTRIEFNVLPPYSTLTDEKKDP